MIVSSGYGSVQSPSENSDVTGFAGSPGGANSSLSGYGNVEAGLIGGTSYISPSAAVQAINSSQNVKKEALQVWTNTKGNYAPSSWYGPNL